MTQRSDIIARLLVESKNFDQIGLIYLGKSSLTDTLLRKVGYRIKLPIALPKVAGLSYKGITFSVLYWLLSYVYIRRILKGAIFDVCWTGSLSAIPLAFLLRKTGVCKRFVYDDADYFPECYSGILAFFAKILEYIALRGADAIISVSEELATIRRKQKANKVHVIPHGVEYARFSKAYEERMRDILCDADFRPRIIVYAGDLSNVLKGDFLLRVLYELCKKRTDITLLLLGSCDGRILKIFLEKAKMMGIVNNVQYKGYVPYEELCRIFQIAHIGLAKPLSPELKYGTTQKVLQYMAAGLPVLATSIGPASNLIVKSRAGIVAEPNETDLATAALALLNLKKLEYLEISKRANETAKSHDWELLLEKYLEILRGL